jgi:hypothetical protein
VVVHQPQPPQHSAPPPSHFVREATATDLLWSIKKSVGRSWQARITDVETVCVQVEEHARSRVHWAEQDGDPMRLEKWSRVVRAIDSDPAGFAAYITRRLEWLALSPELQQGRLAANRRPPSTAQIRLLSRLGGDVHIEDAWQASRAIDKLLRERAS